MAQHLKDDVRDALHHAALRAFAAQGFAPARIADIAAEAGISTGNVYRYYPSKDALFDAVVSPSFVRELVSRLRRRVRAARGVRDLDSLPPDAPWRTLSRAQVDFLVAHRLEVIALLGRPAGTRYADLPERMVRGLAAAAVAHFREQSPGLVLSKPLRFDLEEIYRNLLSTTLHILERFERPEDIRAALERSTRYHLGGLQAFFRGL